MSPLTGLLAMTIAACALAAAPAAAPQHDPGARAKQAYARAMELEAAGNHGAALSLFWEERGWHRATPTCRTGSGRRSSAWGR